MATKTATLTIRLGPNLRAEIERQAEASEMTLGEFVRYVLADYIRHVPTN